MYAQLDIKKMVSESTHIEYNNPPLPVFHQFGGWGWTYVRQQDVVLASLHLFVWALTIVEHGLQPVQPHKLTAIDTFTYIYNLFI